MIASVCRLQGVVVYFRVKDGVMRRGDTVKLMNTKKEYTIDEIGVLSPKPIEVLHLWTCAAGIRSLRHLLSVPIPILGGCPVIQMWYCPIPPNAS